MPLIPKTQPPYYQQGINIKQYVALMTQTGTDIPTVNILHNTIGNIIWTRTGIGDYTGTLNNTFTTNKTICNNGGASLQPQSNAVIAYLQITSQNENTVSVQLYDDLQYTNFIELSTLQGSILINITIYP